MAKRQDLKVIFKQNNQNQIMAIPPTLDELISSDHPVRVVNAVLDKIDITGLISQYRPGGTTSYHPRILLKVLVYAYINNVYSSRKIEEALSNHIHYMWLAGMQKPDHNTINRFRSERLQKTLQPIFTQVVTLLCEEGLLNIKELYTDGTKIEANANRYTFVWGKSIRTNKEKIKSQLNELWQYARSVAVSEMDDTDPSGFDKIDADKVQQTIEKINEALKDKPVKKEVRQKLNYALKNWPSNLKKYEEQEQILGDNRNSYSKTDIDATFMRMKEDHMKNGQLKPAYNVQISTNNQYIASYTIHQNTTDTNTLKDHITHHIKVKHNQFDRLQNETIRSKEPFATNKLEYNEQKDEYICPIGEPMAHTGWSIRETRNSYVQIIDTYQAKNCEGCFLREVCHQQPADREIEVANNYRRLRLQAEKRLKSKKGIEKRKKRCYDVEPVFANLKHNHHFKRFMLRGINKVAVETGLLALAHNLRKKVAA